MSAFPIRSALALCAAIACAAPVLSQEAHAPAPERGTDGLVALPFEIQNTGTVPLICEVKLAHWYSFEIGTAAFGVTLSTTFWSNPETGEVFLLNPMQDQMPVERVWCGVEGRSWATRFEMPLKRQTGTDELPMRYRCDTEPENAVPDAVQATVCTAL